MSVTTSMKRGIPAHLRERTQQMVRDNQFSKPHHFPFATHEVISIWWDEFGTDWLQDWGQCDEALLTHPLFLHSTLPQAERFALTLNLHLCWDFYATPSLHLPHRCALGYEFTFIPRI